MPPLLNESAESAFDFQVRFVPPGGPNAEWPPVEEWVDEHWRHWLKKHNQYAFLDHWSDKQIDQYLNVDRYVYGLGFQRKGEPFHWFYLPGPKAVGLHASKIKNLLYGGAAGGMKSHSTRWDAYRHCFAIPEYRSILMRRTLEELKRNHLDKIKVEAERINTFFDKVVLDFNASDHELRVLAHGRGRDSKIIFGHCKDLGDEEKYLGDEYDDFRPDEGATFEKKQIIGVAGRLRTTKKGVTARQIMTTNPGGAFTLWLKRWFIDKKVPYEENPRYKAENYQFIASMLYDNPYLMDPDGTYTDYEDRLFAYDQERRRQLLLGDWDAVTGQFFPEFHKDRHVDDSIFIPPGCKIERWIDWGYDPHYGICHWVACLPNGRLYVFYEYKFNGEGAKVKPVASEVATNIKRYTIEDVLPMVKCRRITRSICDPSMDNSDGHTGETYFDTFRRCGVSLTKGDNERVMGWGRLRHWFRLAPDGKPWIMYHSRCETAIRTIPSLIRDKHDPDDCNTDGEDHAADADRYGVMGRPTPTKFSDSARIILPWTPAAILADMTRSGMRPPGMVN